MCWLGAAGRAEIIDRIAATVEDRLITLSDVLQEIRIAALLDGTAPAFTAERKREALERLIEYHLLARDMELTRFPVPAPAEVREFLAQVRKARAPEGGAWRRELERYGVGEAALEEHLARRLAVLRYIEFRFRPEALLSEGEIREYGRRQALAAARGAGGSTPPAEEARRASEAALAAERVDELVDAWLKDARRRARIRYREGALE